MEMDTFVVICRDDPVYNYPGNYVLATRRVFARLQDAQHYAQGIARSREPIIVSGYWLDLEMREAQA